MTREELTRRLEVACDAVDGIPDCEFVLIAYDRVGTVIRATDPDRDRTAGVLRYLADQIDAAVDVRARSLS